MEALYRKLYDKYTTLKEKKFSELDEIGKDQEVKFLEYVSAAEEMIQHLRDERDRLSAEVGHLRNEVTLTRSTKDNQYAEYQKILSEENEKNTKLSEEVDRLQKLLQGRTISSENCLNRNKWGTPGHSTSIDLSSGSTRMTRKRYREAEIEMEKGKLTYSANDKENILVRGSAQGSSKATSSAGDLPNDQLPECCKTSVNQSGERVINDEGLAHCHFQALIEYLVGMKLSYIDQVEGTCISALHQSSGYSFSLTWIKKASGAEPELLYRVLSLGTFEVVAPEWMRSVLMFSLSMCPIFFERVSRVIKFHC